MNSPWIGDNLTAFHRFHFSFCVSERLHGESFFSPYIVDLWVKVVCSVGSGPKHGVAANIFIVHLLIARWVSVDIIILMFFDAVS